MKIVSYDLNEPDKNYPNLIEDIKSFSSWCHLHKSVWLIDTKLTSEQVFDRLRTHIDKNDELYVCDVVRYSSVW